MKTKIKLTITIDQELLKQFNMKCDNFSINKSKLVSSMIKNWIENKTKDEAKSNL